jgi:hypothetical protein
MFTVITFYFVEHPPVLEKLELKHPDGTTTAEWTYGGYLLHPRFSSIDEDLRHLVARCLCAYPARRPSLPELEAVINHKLQEYKPNHPIYRMSQKFAENLFGEPGPPPHAETPPAEPEPEPAPHVPAPSVSPGPLQAQQQNVPLSFQLGQAAAQHAQQPQPGTWPLGQQKQQQVVQPMAPQFIANIQPPYIPVQPALPQLPLQQAAGINVHPNHFQQAFQHYAGTPVDFTSSDKSMSTGASAPSAGAFSHKGPDSSPPVDFPGMAPDHIEKDLAKQAEEEKEKLKKDYRAWKKERKRRKREWVKKITVEKLAFRTPGRPVRALNLFKAMRSPPHVPYPIRNYGFDKQKERGPYESGPQGWKKMIQRRNEKKKKELNQAWDKFRPEVREKMFRNLPDELRDL